MKQILQSTIFIFSILFIYTVSAQQAYYNDVNLMLSGMALKSELANKITVTHTHSLSYSQAENALRYTDLDPNDATNTNVLLVYGYSNNLCNYVDESNFGTSADGTYHRRRNKNADVSNSNMCAWNREHIFAQSLGNPDLGQSGPGADAHMLRTCDVDLNGQRGNRLYTSGSGNSGAVGSNWYPGDEWKGDVARIIMYMYLRYGSQCLPTYVVSGTTVSTDVNMPNILLQWNAEDPVSQYEVNRNTYLANSSNTYGQGNRNPFIDNPYLATRIWGGQPAQDIWGIYLSDLDQLLASLNIYPNPATEQISIELPDGIAIDHYEIYSVLGKKVQQGKLENQNIDLHQIENGIYWLNLSNDEILTTKMIIVNK